MAKHLLDQKIDEDKKEILLEVGKNLLTTVRKEVDNRNHWIRCREEQKQKLEEIQARIYKAYDDADESAMHLIAEELRQVLEMKTSKPNPKGRSSYRNFQEGDRNYGDE